MPSLDGRPRFVGRRRPFASATGGFATAALVASTLAAFTCAAPPAFAAPTCQNRGGDTVRCGTGGAMPVGWRLPPGQRADRDASRPADLTLAEGLALVYLVGGLFVLLALMPPFDGWRPGDWGRQEEDEG
jgi:hypothetical protein